MLITDKTTLAELQEAGATTLSDVPLDELLAYVRRASLSVAKDMLREDHHFEYQDVWCERFTDMAESVQNALEAHGEAMATDMTTGSLTGHVAVRCSPMNLSPIVDVSVPIDWEPTFFGNTALVEASTLGWPPGEWPYLIEVGVEGGRRERLTLERVSGLGARTYCDLNARWRLTVAND